jgi:hypothetical protein
MPLQARREGILEDGRGRWMGLYAAWFPCLIQLGSLRLVLFPCRWPWSQFGALGNTTSQHVFLDRQGARAASVYSDGSHALGREHKITVGEQK